ncbi:hypothetical protein Bhyg_12588, partial [Pseudolycoriella hygida]
FDGQRNLQKTVETFSGRSTSVSKGADIVQIKTMTVSPLCIPLICDKVCKYLPKEDLLTCRLLNKHWLSTSTRILKLRGVENHPTVTLTIQNIASHLKFLAHREPLPWIRNYQLVERDTNITNDKIISDFFEKIEELITEHKQTIFSMHLDMSRVTYFDCSFDFIFYFILGTVCLMSVEHLTIHVSSTILQHLNLFIPNTSRLRLIRMYCEDEVDGYTIHILKGFIESLDWPSLEKFVLYSSSELLAYTIANCVGAKYPNVCTEINL